MVKRQTIVLIAGLLLLGGCVERQMAFRSEPTGALVYVNGAEVGRTPCTYDFTWYGNYDVVVRKEGYQTLKVNQNVIAPVWQWIPIDFFAELVPMRLADHRQYSYAMQPQPSVSVDPAVLIDRAQSLRPLLESGEFTRKPALKTPTTEPLDQP